MYLEYLTLQKWLAVMEVQNSKYSYLYIYRFEKCVLLTFFVCNTKYEILKTVTLVMQFTTNHNHSLALKSPLSLIVKSLTISKHIKLVAHKV